MIHLLKQLAVAKQSAVCGAELIVSCCERMIHFCSCGETTIDT